MIGFHGQWGSGKTLSMVEYAYKRFLKKPELVIFTNTPINFPPHPKTGNSVCKYEYSEIMDLQAFFVYAINNPEYVKNRETLVLIDEASVVLSSRTFASIPSFVISFLAQARHINTDFIFTAQAPWEVEKIVRALTKKWYHCRMIPFLGWILRYSEERTVADKLISKNFSHILTNPKKYFKMYNTLHIANLGDHQLREKERKSKIPAKLNDFIDLTYQEPLILKKRLESNKNSLLQKIKYSFVNLFPNLTDEGKIIDTRDKLFFIINK